MSESEIERIVDVLKTIKLKQTVWEDSADIVTCNGKPIGGTITNESKEFDRWWGNELFREIAKELTDKSRIIPKTDSPEKHVEHVPREEGKGIYYKLKWREDK